MTPPTQRSAHEQTHVLDDVRISSFGEEPDVGEDPELALTLAIEIAATEAARRIEQLSHRLSRGTRSSAVGDPNTGIKNLTAEFAKPLRTLPAEITRGLEAAESMSDSGLRVVLMGRTQAGKSTLFEALSHGDGCRIGDGRQGFSRNVCERDVVEVPGVMLVDVPGVGGADGLEDSEVAFAEVPRADLILWVAANEPLQEETARALRNLAWLGKPILVLLNFRMDLDHSAKYDDFLEQPEMVFKDATTCLAMLERHLTGTGAHSVHAAVVHADAAYRATHTGPDQYALRQNSRIGAVLELLRDQRDQAADQRRAIRRVDAVRTPILRSLATLDACASGLRNGIEVERELSRDLRQRLNRVLDSTAEPLLVEIKKVIAKRRRWHLSADPSNGIEARWSREVETMVGDLEKLMTASSKELAGDLIASSQLLITDWESLSQETLDLAKLSGFGSVWVNRLARAAIDTGVGLGAGAIATAVAGAVTGAEWGALAGIEGGPVLMAITGTVGLIAGAALSLAVRPLKDLVDRMLHGAAHVLRKRRAELEEKLGPVLDKAESDATKGAQNLIDAYRDGVKTFVARRNKTVNGQKRTLHQWEKTGKDCTRLIQDLDAATAQALMCLVGRKRSAANVIRAERAAGIAIAVELAHHAFIELALFPARALVEQIVPAPPTLAEAPAFSATHLILGLEPHADLTEIDDHTATFQVPPNVAHSGRLSAWSELLSTFTSSHISILIRPADGHDQERTCDEEGTHPRTAVDHQGAGAAPSRHSVADGTA